MPRDPFEYYNLSTPQNASTYRAFHRGVRQRLLSEPGWINWRRTKPEDRQNYLKTYRLARNGNRFIPTGEDPFAEPLTAKKSLPKIGMSCEMCKKLGKECTGTAPQMCPQCAVAGFESKDCVYSNPLNLTLPQWYTQRHTAGGGGGGGGAAYANAPIQPAVPNRGGAGLAAIRIPAGNMRGKGSPTGMEEENEEANNENETNSNASRNPNATEAEIAAGKAKKQARRNKVARNLEASQLNAGNESAKAVQAMAAGAGGKRKRKSRKRTLKRKQKFTRKQK